MNNFKHCFSSLLTSPFQGSIADREHRKWTEKAIPMAHNPYTKESIEKRLKNAGVGSALVEDPHLAIAWIIDHVVAILVGAIQ